MKRILWPSFLALLLLGLFAASAAADTADTALTLKAPSAVLLEAQSGEVLYESNAEERRYPASVTKLMTLVLALEAVERGEVALDDTVTASAEAASLGGSQVYLFEGEQRSLQEMLIAVAVGSGNDASYAVAEFIGGSGGGFVEMMNERAAELGMTGTHFCNPHGLHEAEHYTTAADLGRLALHAVTVPQLLALTSIYEYDFRPEPKPLKLWNTNRLLKWYEGTDGLKTGYTDEAGRNLLATASRDGLRLISVVLGATEKNGHYTESMKLLNYGFNLYQVKELYPSGAVITDADVEKGRTKTVDLCLGEPVRLLQRKGDEREISLRFRVDEKLQAPLAAGAVVGELRLLRDGEQIAGYELVTAAEVVKCPLYVSLLRQLAAAGLYFRQY